MNLPSQVGGEGSALIYWQYQPATCIRELYVYIVCIANRSLCLLCPTYAIGNDIRPPGMPPVSAQRTVSSLPLLKIGQLR